MRDCIFSFSLWLTVMGGCGFTPSAVGQTRIPREVHVGVLGGVNLSQYSFSPKVTQQMTTGYTAGLGIRYIEETLFGLQAEVHLTQRGYADFYEEDPDLKFSRSLTYVEVPVLAHVYFPTGKVGEVTVDLGPRAAFFLSDAINSNLPDDFGLTGDYEGYTTAHHTLAIAKRFDYGIQGGLGYAFRLSSHYSLELAASYYYGLGNLWPDNKTDYFEQSSNQSIQITLSLWWHHTLHHKRNIH